LGLTVLALAVGCGGSEPSIKTYPVRGKVVFKGGNVSRLERGKVWFQSTSDPGLKAVGMIYEEGFFTMTTLLADKGVLGVPAGQYQARVEPPPDEDRKPQPGLIHAKYQDFNQSGLSFTVPVSDEIVIEVDRSGR
jgi:hypothetical protein